MDKKKIAITSQVNGRVGINVPEMRFKKTWEKKGQKVLVDAEILEEIFYDPGVEYMFRQGILYIEDMDFKKEVGLEPNDAKEPVNIVKIDDAKLARALGPMPVSEFRKFFKPLTTEQKHQVADYAITHECTDFNKSEIIQKAIGINVISAIQLNRQAKDE